MARRIRSDLLTILFAVTALVVAVAALTTPAFAGLVLPADTTTDSAAVQEQVLSLPLSFIENRGQAPADVRFHVSASGHTIAFAPDRITLRSSQETDGTVTSAEVGMTFPGASAAPAIAGLDRMPGSASFFLGNDPSQWREAVPIFGSIEYRQLYPGIDLRYRGTQGVLKREFVVAPDADPATIAIAYDGIEGLALNGDGSLAITTPLGVLTDEAPVAYQEVDGVKVPVASSYRLLDNGTVGFAIGTYDLSRPLVIDPTLLYSTYFTGTGATEDDITRVRVDSAGNIYFAGKTNSVDFPVQNPYQAPGGGMDAFVTKLDPSGITILSSSYFGGSGDEIVQGLSVDDAGTIYLGGGTSSTNFPTQSAFQSTLIDGRA
ncbi:MAG: SBBP repeat-containing protein [Methanospirillum sp.]